MISFHPLVVIETVEEERARKLVVAASQALGHSLFEWSISSGLHYASDHRRGGNAITNTKDPGGVLRHLMTLERQGIFLLKDFAPHVEDPGVARLHASLLTWLQEKRSSVFVVATANDIFSLPPELMRKGRFDEIFFVDLPKAEERRSIFEIHLAQRKQDPAGFTLDDLVFASEGMSGAEIEQAVISALYRALHEGRPLDDALLMREIDGTVPLSRSRSEDIDRLRALAAERFVPVSSAR